jgi:hypothetical protein
MDAAICFPEVFPLPPLARKPSLIHRLVYRDLISRRASAPAPGTAGTGVAACAVAAVTLAAAGGGPASVASSTADAVTNAATVCAKSDSVGAQPPCPRDNSSRSRPLVLPHTPSLGWAPGAKHRLGLPAADGSMSTVYCPMPIARRRFSNRPFLSCESG